MTAEATIKRIEHEYAALENILQNQQNQTVVAVWGLMNAGKSYLLNMLTQHLDTELFKTNDFRETAEIKTTQFNDIIYLDTPGLDANNADDLEAMRGVNHADVVLFVHQPQGALEKIEMDFLRNLKNSFGENAARNIILVISKADKENPEKIQSIEAEMLQQCRELLDFEPKCFQISNTRFHKGMNEHKKTLVQASHINELSEYVQQVAKESMGVNKQRALGKLATLASELNQVMENIKQEQQMTIEHLENEFAEFNSLVDDLRQYIGNVRQEYISMANIND